MPYYEKELAQIVAELNRAAPGPRESREVAPPENPGNLESLDQLLVYAVRQTASDLLLIAGAPVTLRVGGELSKPGGPPLEAEDTRSLLLPVLTPRRPRSCSAAAPWISASIGKASAASGRTSTTSAGRWRGACVCCPRRFRRSNR